MFIRKWHIAAIAAISLIAIGVSSYLYYRSEEIAIRTNKQDELAAVAKLKVVQIEQWITERRSEAEFFSTAHDVKTDIISLLGKQTIVQSKKSLTEALSGIQKNHGYENILIIDRKYHQIFALYADSLTADDYTLLMVDSALSAKGICPPALYFCKNHKKIHIDFMAPVINSKGVAIAAIIFRIDPNTYLYPLIQNWPLPSKTAETLIIQKDIDSVLFLNTLKFRTNSALKFRISLSETTIPAIQAVQGKIGIVNGFDYRGKEVLAFLCPIQGVPWYMVAKIDAEEVYDELYYRAMMITLFGALLTLIIVFAVTWGYHYRQRNIYQQLFFAEKNLHEKEEEFRTTLYSIGDAVISTNIDGRITQMNKVAESLTGYTEDQAIGEPFSKIVNIVNNKTQKSVKNPVQQVLKTGNIVGNASHTILVAKDGRETPIMNSGAPIINSSGEMLGVVLIFQNIKEEYTLQEALRKNEERLQITLKEMQIGVWDWDLINDKWYESPIYHTMLGYTDEEGPLNSAGWRTKIHPNDIGAVSEIIVKCIAGQTSNFHYEARMLHANGNYRWQSVTGHSIEWDSNNKVNRVIGIRTDITQRKAELENLRISEERFRSVFEHAGVGKSITTKEGNISPNNAFAQMLGYTKEQLAALNWQTITHPDDVEYNANLLKKLFEGNGTSVRFEKRYIHNNKSIVWVDITTSIMRDEEENPLYLISTIIDITEQKRITQELEKNENQLHTLVQTIPDLVWLKDNNGVYLACNWMFERFVGAKEEEIIGKTDFDFVPADLAEFFRKNDSMAMAAGFPTKNEEWVTFADDGHKALLETTKMPLIGNNKKLIGVMGIAREITAARQTEQERFKLLDIIEKSVNEIYLFNLESLKFEYLNHGALENIGYSLEEITNLTPIDIKPEFSLEEFRLRLLPLIAKEEKQIVFETIHQRKDGTTYPVEEHLQLHDQDGKKLFLAVINDISQRKVSEKALRESQQLFETLAQVSPVGIFRTRIDGCTTYVNPTWTSLTGLSFDEALGFDWLKAVHPDDRARLTQKWGSALQGSDSSITEYRFLRPDGTSIWVLGNAVPEYSGNEVTGYIGTITNISSRKEFEDALTKSELLFRTLFENVGEGIVVANTTEQFEYANTAAENIFGVVHGGLVGLSLTKFVSDKTYQNILKETEQRRQNIKSVYELEIMRADGNIRNLLVTAVPRYENNDKFIGTFGVIRDITEQKIAQQEILKLNETLERKVIDRTQQLEAANKDLESFSYSVSHDLRAPLRHIDGFVSILLNDFQEDLPQEAKRYLNTIIASAKQMGTLIDDLLKFSRTGRLEMNKKTFSMDRVVANAINQVMQIQATHPIEWIINPLPEAFGDENLLQLAWVNLVENAVKYSRNCSNPKIEIGTITKQSETIFYIRDNGVGFDMQYAQKLFGVFQRMHSEKEFEGTGIGLANVHRIITRHGGKIWAEAEPNKGATFFFTLPTASLS
ncbi:PAS domain S-box protein [Williamwhitmania taraxaci]|nr:PAS domain S-box protein [Williamwhitmania taraxaci]